MLETTPQNVIQELDIVFDSGVDWEYGPAAAVSLKVDFESVSAHELGHGHQLLHVIDSGALMHWAIAPGDNNRVLSADDISGGNDVQSRSEVDIPCAPADAMTAYDCTASVDDQLLAESIGLYPNPVKDKLIIQNKTHAKRSRWFAFVFVDPLSFLFSNFLYR